MDVSEVWPALGERLSPGEHLSAVPAPWLWAALAVGVAATLVPWLWRLLRVGVTVVHELGHAVVGILVGRSFIGLVLRPDMSGHAVTVGRARGPGRVATTWAGYPAPALVGAGLVLAGTEGWAAPVLAGLVVLLLGGLLRVRSLYSAAVMVLAVGVTAWLWWAGTALLQGLMLLAVGVLLLLGAWRHLAAVARRPGSGSDPAVLARITPVPAVAWLGSFVLVLAGCSWLAGRELWALLERSFA